MFVSACVDCKIKYMEKETTLMMKMMEEPLEEQEIRDGRALFVNFSKNV